MCEDKCAAFEYSIRVGTEVEGASERDTEILVEAGNKCATAFQVVDDLICLNEGSDDFGGDITEGKKTIQVIHTASNPESSRLLSILSMHTQDLALIKEAISILHETGGIEQAKTVAKSLADEAIILLTTTFPNSRYRRILFSIIDYGLSRNE